MLLFMNVNEGVTKMAPWTKKTSANISLHADMRHVADGNTTFDVHIRGISR